MKRQLARNTIINYAKTGVIYGIRLLLVPIVLKELGATLYGVFILAGTIFAPSDLIQSGFGLTIAKHVAECRAKEDDERLNRLVSTSFVVLGSLALMVAAGLLVFVLFFFTRVFNIPPQYQQLTTKFALISILGFVIGFPASLFMRVLEGWRRYDLIALVEMVTEALRLGIFVTVLSTGAGLIGLGVSNAVLGACTVVLTSVIVWRTVPQLRLSLERVNRNEANEVFSFSWKVIAVKLSGFLGDRINPWIIAVFMPVAALTPYSIANQFHSVGRLVPSLAGSASMPVASELHAVEDERSLAGLCVKLMKYTAAISLPFLLAGIVLARPLIIAWVGPEYASAAPLAQVYLSYLLVYLLALAVGGIMIGTERFVKLLKPMYVATVINVILSIVLVQRIGVMGVVIGSVVGNLIVWGAYMWVAFRDFEIYMGRFFVQVVARAYLLAVPVYLGLWAVSVATPPEGLVPTVLYGAAAAAVYWLLFLLLGLDRGEKADVFSGLRLVLGRFGKG